MKTQHKSECI